MIVAPETDAAEAGAEILQNGGNAVDAAIACGLVQAVVDPLMSGIAGFGSMHVWIPERGAHEIIDFYACAPSLATPEMWQDKFVGETRDGSAFVLENHENEIGYRSIAVPGTLAGFRAAHRAYGRLPWQRLVEAAIAAADTGFLVRLRVFEYWLQPSETGISNFERLSRFDATRRIFCKQAGEFYGPGERIRNPSFAKTLRRIAAPDGATDFYVGDIAREIAADMERGRGLLRLEDLQSYRAERTPPLWGRYRGYRIATNRPPGGGITLLQMLQMLQHFDLPKLGHNSPEYIRVVSEAMKRATIDRDRYLADPRYVEVPLDRLADPERAGRMAEEIARGERVEVPRISQREHSDTTHVSVLDSSGNAVALTQSLGVPSGVVTDGLGFMYNGCMSGFDPRPGRLASIAPGKRRHSSICPTIVFREEEPVLVIGAPGGAQIPMGVLQVILNLLDHEMSPLEAVSAPRFSATSDVIDVANRIPASVTLQLERAGFRVARSPLAYDFAKVHVIEVGATGLRAAADPAGDGIAIE